MNDCCLLFHWTSLGEPGLIGEPGDDGNPGPQGRQLAHQSYPFTTIDPVNDYCLCPPGPPGPTGPTGPQGRTGPTGKIVNYDPFSIYFSFQFYFVWPSLEVGTVFRVLLPKRCSRNKFSSALTKHLLPNPVCVHVTAFLIVFMS